MEQDGDRTAAESLYRGAIADFERALAMDAGAAKRIGPSFDEARMRLRALRP